MSARGLLSMLLLTGFMASSARAQLISPGKLSGEHANLEGLRGCTNCHDLGRRGVSDPKCLDCHGPLKARIVNSVGLHADLPTGCATCHKEHFGREFDLVRLDTAAFLHERAGWALDGAHIEARCAACHRQDRIEAADVRDWIREHPSASSTKLGLTRTCTTCHADDDPHDSQFRDSCDRCHDSATWQRANRFDHSRTSYALTGGHAKAACSGCHTSRAGAVVYVGTSASRCAQCHDDAHAGAMGSSCEQCHAPSAWDRVARTAVEGRFDHANTRFPLRGGHAFAACEACHSQRPAGAEVVLRFTDSGSARSYPRPQFNGCTACHVDRHGGQLADGAGGVSCERCHSEQGWSPSSFDIDRHRVETGFPLEGAHAYTPCNACHTDADGAGHPLLRLEPVCETCHAAQSPHEDRFGDRPCADCHTVNSFAAASFDHSFVAGRACAECHAAVDPHAGQFEDADCGSCHVTESFAIAAFDHDRTRFVLDGAHVKVDCGGCHPTERAAGTLLTRYRPRPLDCAGCHGGPQ